MRNSSVLGGLLAAIMFSSAGCASKKEADNKGTYIHARHAVTGSNIPVPDRAGGNSDTADADLEREQYQKLQQDSSIGGMPREGGH